MWEREGASANNLQILLPKPLFLRPSPRSHSRCVYANVCKTGYNFMLCGHYPSPSPVPLPLPPPCTGYVNSHQAQQVRTHRPRGRIGKGRDHRNDHLSLVLALHSPFPMTHTHTNTHGGCDDDHQGGGGFPRFQSCSFSSSLPFSCSLLPSPCISPDSLPRSHSFSLAPSCLRKALGPLAVLLAYLMMGRRTLSQHSFPFG